MPRRSTARLRHLTAQIGTAAETPAEPNGASLAALVLQLRQRKDEAVASEDFTAAQELKDSIAVLDGSVHASIPAGQ